MKDQVLFSLKNNEKKYSRLSSTAVVLGALRVKSDTLILSRNDYKTQTQVIQDVGHSQ